MAKRKAAFNVIDALIIIVVAAAAVVLYAVFFRGGETEDPGDLEIERIRYVVQVSEISEDYADNIAEGEKVFENESHALLGTVMAVDSETSVHVGQDKINGGQKLTPNDGYVDMYITIEADAQIVGNMYQISGTGVYVGKRLVMKMPDLFCAGYLVSIEAVK